MEIIPAIDILDGRCVRLRMGDFNSRIDYSEPMEAANWIAESGATWLHLVDLNAARGDGNNSDEIAEIVRSTQLSVQVGGGVRTLANAVALYEIGVKRLVLGTRAVEEPGFIADVISEVQIEIVVSLDYRVESGIPMVQVRGWTSGSGLTLRETLARSEEMGASYVLATDVGRDGMLTGPDLGTYCMILDETDMELIASGGVSDLTDLERLAELRSPTLERGVHSVVVGRAIHDRRIELSEVIELWR